ncbi:hypothetical protein C808_02271 [Lachnospiraceae bacterium M18-1]|nr:hypothetical protein C808_02271 [Lachnospiraceae bacterium M18-1]
MKEKIKKYLMVFVMVAGMFLSAAMPAFAYTGNTDQETGAADAGVGTVTGTISTETEHTEDAPVTEEASDSEDGSEEEETPGRVNGTTFSVPGNGELVDDLPEDESKQFLTIQTKNGNTFFMVLDRSNNTENVYMLSMIDENDLAEFIGDGGEQKEKEQVQPSVVIPETENPSVSTEQETETKDAPEDEEKKGGMSTGTLLAVVLLLAGGIGGFYYFKVWKPKQDEDESDEEGMEFYDGGAYINEEQDDSDEEEDE